MITAILTNNSISSKSEEAFSLYEKSRFGEKKHNLIEYMPVEALFLIKEKKMNLFLGKNVITDNVLMKKLKKIDKRIEIKYPVFSNLRKKGYIIKTALKFGAEFRVYNKGIKPGEDHASWLLFSVKENEPITWYDFAAKNRVATSTKKRLLIGILDEEGDVTYYEVNWLKI